APTNQIKGLQARHASGLFLCHRRGARSGSDRMAQRFNGAAVGWVRGGFHGPLITHGVQCCFAIPSPPLDEWSPSTHAAEKFMKDQSRLANMPDVASHAQAQVGG